VSRNQATPQQMPAQQAGSAIILQARITIKALDKPGTFYRWQLNKNSLTS
jgi:hypothetical protein